MKKMKAFVRYMIAALILVSACVAVPAEGQAKKAEGEIRTEWKKAGDYSFKLKKHVLTCKDAKGKQTVIDKHVWWAFASGSRVVYNSVADQSDFDDLFSFEYIDPTASKRGVFKIEPLASVVKPVFYYKDHLMLYQEYDYGMLYCIRTAADVKNWKLIPVVEFSEGYSYSFKRIGQMFYFNDRLFWEVNDTSVGIFNMKTDKIRRLKNAWSAAITDKKIFYVSTKIKNDYLPAQVIKVYSCSKNGTGKKCLTKITLKKKIPMGDFHAFADGKAVYWRTGRKYYKKNYRSGKTSAITKKAFNTFARRLTIIG